MFSGGFHPVFDPVVVESIVEFTPWWLALALVFLTHLGSVYVVVPATVLAYLRYPNRFGTWLGAIFCYFGLMTAVKSLNPAIRPTVDPAVGPEHVPEALTFWYSHGAEITTTSFPSGNVMVATVLMTLVVLETNVSTFRRRLLAGSSFVVLIAYSRLALGVHYPVDVIGGVVLGLALVGLIALLRNRTEEEVAAVFTLAVILCGAAVWLRTGVWATPSMAGLESSNRPLALGGAVGGLLAWQFTRRNEWHLSMQSVDPVVSALVFLGILVGVYTIHTSVSHPLLSTVWAAAIFGIVVATPWLWTRRESVTETPTVVSK